MSGEYVESGYWEYGYAQGDQQGATANVGAIGASAIGVHAIGEVSTQTTVSADPDATASAAGVTVTVNDPAATAGIAVTASASGVTLTLSDPAATATGGATISVDGHKARQTFTVTVSNDGYGNKYYIDGVKQDSLSLHEVGIYRFDVSDSTVSGHPFKFSTTSDGTHNSGTEYTTNVTTSGATGTSGAYVEIEVTASTPDLYYYCDNHSGMGGSITFVEDFSQVPFVIERSLPAASASAGAITQVQAATIGLTAAEASVLAGATATFSDSIEVGITAPAATVNLSPTAQASGVTISVTAPAATANVVAQPSGATLSVQHETRTLSFDPAAKIPSVTYRLGALVVSPKDTASPIPFGTQFKAFSIELGHPNTLNSDQYSIRIRKFDEGGNLPDSFLAAGDRTLTNPGVPKASSNTTSSVLGWDDAPWAVTVTDTYYADSDGVEWPVVHVWLPYKEDLNGRTYFEYRAVQFRTDNEAVATSFLNSPYFELGDEDDGYSAGPNSSFRANDPFTLDVLQARTGFFRHRSIDLTSTDVDGTVISTGSTAPSLTTFKSTIESNDSDATHIEGAADDPFVYTETSTPSVTASANITVSDLPTINITAPTAGSASNGTAQPSGATVSIAAPSASASLDATATASGVTLSLSAPAASVSVEATAQATGVTVSTSSPVASASGTATAQATGQTITVSAPATSAEIGDSATATGVTVDVAAPVVSASGTATATATLPTVSVTSPAALITTDTETDDITGTSTASGSLLLIQSGAASVTGTTSVSGAVTQIASASGSVSATATVSGEGTTLQDIEGSVTGSATTSAEASLLKDAACSSTGSTNLSASCTIVKDVGSTVSGTATASASIETYILFSGSTEATASTSASLDIVFGLAGTVESSATLTASAFVTTPLVAGDISPFRTITIPADPPSVVTVHSDRIRYALIFPERRRYIRIVS